MPKLKRKGIGRQHKRSKTTVKNGTVQEIPQTLHNESKAEEESSKVHDDIKAEEEKSNVPAVHIYMNEQVSYFEEMGNVAYEVLHNISTDQIYFYETVAEINDMFQNITSSVML